MIIDECQAENNSCVHIQSGHFNEANIVLVEHKNDNRQMDCVKKTKWKEKPAENKEMLKKLTCKVHAYCTFSIICYSFDAILLTQASNNNHKTRNTTQQ